MVGESLGKQPQDFQFSPAEEYAHMILRNGQQAIRSAKETILEVIGRSLSMMRSD